MTQSTRGRPSKTIKSVQMNISLPEDLATRVKLHLHSEVEGKIPHGKQMEFFVEVVNAAFGSRVANILLERGIDSAEPLLRCAAASDGECWHSQCPQIQDGEPQRSGRHCPLDTNKGAI